MVRNLEVAAVEGTEEETEEAEEEEAEEEAEEEEAEPLLWACAWPPAEWLPDAEPAGCFLSIAGKSNRKTGWGRAGC